MERLFNPDAEDTVDDHLNNDFCFTEEDFIESQTVMNDATRHWGAYNITWYPRDPNLTP